MFSGTDHLTSAAAVTAVRPVQTANRLYIIRTSDCTPHHHGSNQGRGSASPKMRIWDIPPPGNVTVDSVQTKWKWAVVWGIIPERGPHKITSWTLHESHAWPWGQVGIWTPESPPGFDFATGNSNTEKSYSYIIAREQRRGTRIGVTLLKSMTLYYYSSHVGP